jgi:UDP-glucose 4-epimerase
MNSTSLVTGGAGFIGSHVVNHLLNLGHQVVVIDDLSGGFEQNVNKKAILHKGSITDTTLINELFNQYQFDYVYHLAAYAAEGLSHFIRRYNYQNNLIGSINLINASINNDIKCFVFTSSIAVYGTNELPLHEAQNPKPEDPYGVAKYAVEMDLLTAKKMFGLNSIIFRPHNVYGIHQNIGDKYRNVVGIFMNQTLQEQPLTIFGDGQQTRAFSHIDDVAPYIAQSVDNEQAYNQVFNIGNNKPNTVKELALAISEVMGTKTKIKSLEHREEVTHAYADHQKFENIFKPKEYIELKEGLKEMALWVTKHGSRKSSDFSEIEIQKNLPESWK